ncbi:MAG: hypothetical protein HY425_02830 [Candidatus Levybacteria bacterium]|nr:hypothetical protein [Candidatus Levybacteria bacterium]
MVSSVETLGGRVDRKTVVGSRRSRDAFGRFVEEAITRVRSNRNSAVLTTERGVGSEAIASQASITFLQLDELLENSISSIGGKIGKNPRRDWISGDFPQAVALIELKKARQALRDIGVGKTTVELLDGRDDDFRFLVHALGVRDGKKTFPMDREEIQARLLALDHEIESSNNKGSLGRGGVEALSLEKRSLTLQLTLLDIPERDYAEVEKIKGAKTNMKGVSADILHYSFAGVPHSRVTITLNDEMREKAKDDLQNLPPLANKVN